MRRENRRRQLEALEELRRLYPEGSASNRFVHGLIGLSVWGNDWLAKALLLLEHTSVGAIKRRINRYAYLAGFGVI